MGKRIAISQSNYIPWKGYFDQIHSVDEFVLYDDEAFATELVRVPYEIARTAARITAAGLPVALAERLQHGR